MIDDAHDLTRALELACSAAGLVGPRPPVGATVVKDGASLGEGATAPSPGPHAEITALQQAGEAARGATLYVTLEPCSHSGATPPCTDAILRAGVARVVAPLVDPDPRVNGRGFELLRAAGVEVGFSEHAALKARALRLIEPFAHHLRTGRPLVTAKFATSLDGKIATRTGQSQWITGPEARRYAHRLRARSDAVMAGIGTILADDPRLTARDESDRPTGRPRLRVIVDTAGRLPESARLLREPGDILWAVAKGAAPRPSTASVELLQVPSAGGGLDLAAVLDGIGARGFTSLLVEGGSTLLGGLFDRRLIDRVAAFISPIVIGGRDAPGPVSGGGVAAVADAMRLEDTRVVHLGPDTLITGRVASDDGGTLG